MYRNILAILDGSQRESWNDFVTEIGRLVSGTDARVTLLAVETVPEAVAEEAVESGNIVSVATLVFAVPAAALARREPSHLAFETVREELEWRLEDAGRSLEDRGIKTEYAVRFGDVVDVTREYWLEHESDLLVVPVPWRRGLSRLVSGSLVNDLLKDGIGRVLLVPVGKGASHPPSERHPFSPSS